MNIPAPDNPYNFWLMAVGILLIIVGLWGLSKLDMD